MGNKWDLERTESKLVCKCPCKEGGFYYKKFYYQDQFMNDHSNSESYVSCFKCNEKYLHIDNNNWIEKSKYESIISKYPVEEFRKNLYKQLYTKYFNTFEASFKTQKGLYEFLKSERKFSLPGTVETFRKHKLGYYLTPNNYYHLEDFITVLVNKREVEIETGDITSIKEFLTLVQEKEEALSLNLITVE